MANIQIADLHSENFVELTAEEQSLIQGGWRLAFKVAFKGAEVVLFLIGAGDAIRDFYTGAKKAWNEGCGC